jgi:hypothetical protein
VGGIVNGAIDAVQEIVGGILHIVKDVGSIVGSILRLDLPGLIDAFLHLLVDIRIFILDVVRTVTLGFFIGHIVENFERNSLREFVDDLLQAAFDEPRRTQGLFLENRDGARTGALFRPLSHQPQWRAKHHVLDGCRQPSIGGCSAIICGLSHTSPEPIKETRGASSSINFETSFRVPKRAPDARARPARWGNALLLR